MSRKIFKIKKFVFILFILLNIPFIRATEFLRLHDSIPAGSIYRGGFRFQFMFFQSGGIDMRIGVAITDFFFIGISDNVEGLIGNKRLVWHYPGVMAKLRILSLDNRIGLGIAIGYDIFNNGSQGFVNNKNIDGYYSKLITYGPYIALTKGVYLFGAEQHINLGVRMPVQPYFSPMDTEIYLSVDIPIMPELMIFGEIVNIRFPFYKWIDINYNIGLRYTFFDRLGIQATIQFHVYNRIARFISITYTDYF